MEKSIVENQVVLKRILITIKKAFFLLSTIFVSLIIVVYTILYFNQEKLIFLTQGISVETMNHISESYTNVEQISIKTVDNTNLHGWIYKNSKLSKQPLIIYFGGNAEEVSYLIEQSDKFRNWSIALINYRGYGMSEGKPNEKNLFNDALSIYDYFSNRKDIDNQRIIAMGRSIGSGVAVYLSSNRNVKGTILVTPYDSFDSVVQETMPWAPAKLLLRNHFNSIKRAPAIKVPLLALAASNDTTIPPYHAQNLVGKWGGEAQLMVIEGGHNTIQNNEQYWKSIGVFLEKLLK